MRAHEFITEVKKTKMRKDVENATTGRHTFTDAPADRFYTLGKVMSAAACSNGYDPLNVPAETWVGKRNTAHPYTDIEDKMMKQAYKAVGAKWEDHNHGDLRSMEPDNTNAVSPMMPFKGYKR